MAVYFGSFPHLNTLHSYTAWTPWRVEALMVNRIFIHVPQSTLEVESFPLLQLEHKELARGLLTGFPSLRTELVTRARDCPLSIVPNWKVEAQKHEFVFQIFYFCSPSECNVFHFMKHNTKQTYSKQVISTNIF